LDRLKGRVAVITGGCSGIGLGTVRRFVAEGAKVMVGDISDEAGRKLAAEYDGEVAYRHCDVMVESDIEALMAAAVETFGGLDILFNNAGAGGAGNSISDMTGDAWDLSCNLLLRSVALGIRYAVPHMKARGKGSIINTASIAGVQAGAGPIAYSVAKAGVIHLTRLAAAELGRDNIRVNAISPGLILTNIFTPLTHMPEGMADMIKAQMAQRAPDAQPVPKAGLPEDAGAVVAFFASDDAAYVTGVSMLVDGGAHVGPRHSWDPVMRAERQAEREARRAAYEAAQAEDAGIG
jgi:NAD(P)-dependent dehydrogenase (short-subunit alcohol dehydrogenase family)